MSLLSAIAALFRRKPQPTVRPVETDATPDEILDEWDLQPEPRPDVPPTSPERLAEIRGMIPSWGRPVGKPRFDLLYLGPCDEVMTREEGWYVQNAIRPAFAKDLTPETVAQAKLAVETFPINLLGWKYYPRQFEIPDAK